MKTTRSFLVVTSLILCAHAFGDMARPPDARAEEPAKTDSLLHRAGDLMDDERFAAAQAVLETLAAIAPENANVLASLGQRLCSTRHSQNHRKTQIPASEM